MRLLFVCFIFLLLPWNLLVGQPDSTRHKNPINFGLGFLSGITFNDHPPKSPRNDPLGLELMVEGFIEKRLLENTTGTIGLGLSYFKGAVSNNSISSIEVLDSFVLAERKTGSVNISCVRMKIPLRFRFYYFDKKRIRGYLEPGLFFITELFSTREYNYEKTTYYDELTKTPFVPPSIELISEKLVLSQSDIGLSLGIGFEIQTPKGQTFFLSSQYQRASLYQDSRRSVTHHLFSLEIRYLLQRKSESK